MDIFISLVIAGVIILVWFLWAQFIYKWDLDRIGNRAVKKYSTLNKDKLTDQTYFAYSAVTLSSDKLKVGLNIDLRDQLTQQIISSDRVEYNLENCEITNPNYFICLTF